MQTSSDKIVPISNPEKIFWGEEQITKGDLIDYYRKISPYILPYIINKPQSLHRFPDGYKGKSFYQKNTSNLKLPTWIKTTKIKSLHNQKFTKYLVCDSSETLIYMINLGCIEIHPWASKIKKIDYPDWIVFDLDPIETDFKNTVKVALSLREMLSYDKWESYCKTSGFRGIHIFVPTKNKFKYESAKEIAKQYAIKLHLSVPEITSLNRNPQKRVGKVYIDYLQNSRGQTVAAPYSVRPNKKANVSTPLLWKEVNEKLDPKIFTLRTIMKRLEIYGDVWKEILN